MRRLAAIFYDAILLFCIIFMAWQPVPLLSDELDPLLSKSIKLIYLLTISFLYFGWFWRNGGQTLGMRTWKIKLEGETAVIPWRALLVRFLFALLSWASFGMGYLSSAFHRQNQTWHDLASGTRLIIADKRD